MKYNTITFWANAARIMTNRAATAKDWTLTRKRDKEMKKIAKEMVAGRGYIIATDKELEAKYPAFFKTHSAEESKKMIWGISYSRYNRGDKMAFCPVR